jgi:hypothetical protein
VSNLTSLSGKYSTEEILTPIGLTQSILCGRLAPGTPVPGHVACLLTQNYGANRSPCNVIIIIIRIVFVILFCIVEPVTVV